MAAVYTFRRVDLVIFFFAVSCMFAFINLLLLQEEEPPEEGCGGKCTNSVVCNAFLRN